jgi:hypothetical protein
MRRKFLPSRMLFVFAFGRCCRACGGQRFASAFRFHFLCADARLQVQQLQLIVAELLALRPVPVDQFEAQTFFESLYFQAGPLQFLRQQDDLFGFGAGLRGG